MATEIKRSLYIGLGGTGMSTLLSTKRFFVETYGEVPPMIGFLGIDADRDFFTNTTIDSKNGKIKLTPNEFCPIIVQNALPNFKKYKNQYYDWLPPENVNSLAGLAGDGCGQVRSNGRFSFFHRFNDIEQHIQRQLVNITDATHTDNPKYAVINGGKIDIHMIFSLSGGTGCGIFLDLAYLLKEIQQNLNINAYAVLPDVFDAFLAGPAKRLIYPNAYGALVDLDYLMHIRVGEKNFPINYPNGKTINIDEPPFRTVVLIDNKNKNGDTYNNISQITEMLGIALATSAGKFSTAEKSAMDNVKGWINDGAMDVDNKVGWTSGIGIGEIQFNGLELSNMYACKAARNLIQKMVSRDSDVDINSFVNQWIDSPEVQIREDKGQDNVIDAILRKTPEQTFTDSSINSYENPQPDIDDYINNFAHPQKENVDLKVNLLSGRVSLQLMNKLDSIISSNFGIGNSIYFLNELLNQIHVFLKEMNEELKSEKLKGAKIENRLKTDATELVEATKLPIWNIGKKNKVRAAVSALVETVKNKAISIRESTRRQAAISFFSGLKNLAEDNLKKLETFSKTLENIDFEIGSRINQMQIAGNHQNTFIISLHNHYSRRLNVISEEIDVNQFSKSLSDERTLLALLEENKEKIKTQILDYTRELQGCKMLHNLSIEDVLRELPIDEYKHVLKQAISKSMPLYSLNYEGYNEPERHVSFIVGVPDEFNTVLKPQPNTDDPQNQNTKPGFAELVEGTSQVEIVSTGARNKIIVYRQEAASPVFAISGIRKYKEKSRNATRNCHFDSNILQTMQLENFNLYPADSSIDNSVELWVKGIVFGHIINEGGIYYLKTTNPKLTNALSHYKYKLNTETHRREHAFEKFKSIKDLVKEELTTEINKFISDRGEEYMHDMRQKYTNDTDYIHKDLAQIKMKVEWLNETGQKEINKLVLEEFDYIKKNF